MTADPGEPDRQPRRGLVLGGLVLLAAAATGTASYLTHDDDPATPALTVTWGGSEGHPSCVYDPEAGTVDATIAIGGEADPGQTVTVTVTAYADENTSDPVGSGSRSVDVEGAVDTSVVVTFPVEKAPMVDVDGETACRLDVEQ